MRNWFPSEMKYRAYLVYNSEDPEVFYNNLMANYDTVKGSFPSTEAGKLEALDTGIRQVDPTAKITGVVLVSYKTLAIS